MDARKSFAITIVSVCALFGNLALSHAAPEDAAWSDTFADASGIDSSTDAIQVTDSTGIGTSFTPDPGNPLLTLETCDPWDAGGDPALQIPGAVHPDVLYFPDGMDGYKFWMVFTPLDDSLPPGASGSADYWWERPTLVRSNDGVNWEKTPDYTNPVVAPGVPGEWDDDWLADPDVVYAPGAGPGGESWFVYYTGCSPCRNGVALSYDGKSYTKAGPVMPSYTRCPTVFYDDTTGTFHGWYNWGSFEVGYATSLDGVNWTPYNPTTPGAWGHIVYRATPGTYDQGGVSHMDVIYHDGQYWMYYLAMPTGSYAGLVVGLATSPDGINWTQYPQPPMSPGETWTFYQPPWLGSNFTDTVKSLYRPSAVVVEDGMYLYYGGTDTYSAYPANTYEIGVAYSTGPDGHVELEQDSNPAEYTVQADTVAWYHMNGGGTTTYPGEYAPLDPTLAWYHFNETTGTTAADSGGSIVDDGTLNSPTWTTGLYGNGLSFDGNDRVTVDDSTELNPTDAITLEAWVNPDVSKSNNYVAIKMTPGSGDYAYGMKIESSVLWGLVVNASGTLYWSKGGAIPTGTWTHVAMTYEMNSSGTAYVKLYMNGAEVSYSQADTIPASTLIRTNTGPLNIGVIPVGSPIYYQGDMDEVRMMGRALSAAEIAADGAVSIPTLADSSGYENDGSFVGGVDWTTGLFSDGLTFSGSGKIEVPDSPELNPTDALTIEVWVNPAVTDTHNYVISKMTPSGTDHSYGINLSDGAIRAYVRPADSGTEYYSQGGSIPTGTWTHIAMTYEMDPADNTYVTLYQDGVEVTSYTVHDAVPPGTLILTNTGSVHIGCLPWPSGSYYYQGLMDELRILSRALTANEVLADYGTTYRASGDLTSVLIAPQPKERWSSFFADADVPAGTSITYSILDEGGTPLVAPVNPTDDISSLGRKPIRLYAQLTTTVPWSAPFLNEWGVTSLPWAPGDFNFDDYVDLDDFGLFQACITGPAAGPPAEGCDDADLDGDSDVDLADYGGFQRCYRGAGVPADPDCLD